MKSKRPPQKPFGKRETPPTHILPPGHGAGGTSVRYNEAGEAVERWVKPDGPVVGPGSCGKTVAPPDTLDAMRALAAPAIVTTPRLTEAQEAERATWQYRAIDRCKGNQTWMGRVLLSALGRVPNNPPWYGLTAVISVDGFLFTIFVDKDRHADLACVGEVSKIVDAFKRLADVLDFSEEDTIAMFKEVQRWVSKDYRAINNKEGDDLG